MSGVRACTYDTSTASIRLVRAVIWWRSGRIDLEQRKGKQRAKHSHGIFDIFKLL